MLDMFSLKRCSKCKRVKPLDQFPKNRSKKDGLATECHECNRKRARKWSSEHPEQAAEGKRLYVLRHPERRRQSWTDYTDKHRNAVYERNRRYYYANLEKCRQKSNERAKKYYRDHRDDILPKRRASALKWRKNNPNWYSRDPGRYKSYWAKRQARKKSLPDAFSSTDWQRSLTYFNNCCAACGRPVGLWHTLAADHWIPLNSPICPGTIPTNVLPLCHGSGGCNNSKADRDPVEWLVDRFGKRKGKAILKRIQDYFEWVKQQG